MSEITKQEFEQYDRQIRLWGIDAQKRLRKSKVLLIGMGGLGAEIAKNLVLSGIDSITLMDDRNVEEVNFTSQFFLKQEDIGRNIAEASVEKAQNLNPNVKVKSANYSLASYKETDNFDVISEFDVVCLTGSTCKVRNMLDQECRKRKVKFVCGSVYGFYSFTFFDWMDHEYVEDQVSKEEDAKEVEQVNAKLKAKNELSIVEEPPLKKAKVNGEEQKFARFCSFDQAMQEKWTNRKPRDLKRYTSQAFFVMQMVDKFHENHQRFPMHIDEDYDELEKIRVQILDHYKMKTNFVDVDFKSFCIGELCPTCAVTGGVISQEVIKCLSKKGIPHKNTLMFDGRKKQAIVDLLGEN